jgi:uncharacterized membrane protein
MSIDKRGIGQVIAPWPFLIFGVVSLTGTAIFCPWFGLARGIMVGFDIGALSFLAASFPLFSYAAIEMRRAALRNDANRGSLLLIATVVMGVILVAVGSELSQKGRPRPLDLILVILTLCLCWAFSNLVYALHYAHLFYTRDETGKDWGGLDFPDTKEPDYWDFAYFASCLGMTFQTSDVKITSNIFRRTSMFHCLGAFVFNLGIIAFTINILGSS